MATDWSAPSVREAGRFSTADLGSLTRPRTLKRRLDTAPYVPIAELMPCVALFHVYPSGGVHEGVSVLR
jgi:hypothetical protein